MSNSINGPSIFDSGVSPAIGSGGAAGTKGLATLVSGTVTIAIAGLTSTSVANATSLTPIGTLGAELKCVCSANQLVITSVTTGLGTQILDNSIVQYIVFP